MSGTKRAKIVSSVLTGVSAIYGASALYKYFSFLEFGDSGVHSLSSVVTHSEIALFLAGVSAAFYWGYGRKIRNSPEYKELPRLAPSD